MKIQFFTFLFFVIYGIQVFAQVKFENALEKILQKSDYKNASVGILVYDLQSDKAVFELNANKLLIPASTMKIVTTASALEILGAGYRFKTKIGYVGQKVKTSELDGDMVIIGGGDPTLGSEYFRNFELSSNFIDIWVKKIKAAGIKRINGDLILDGSVYDSEKIPPTWIWEDMGNYYGAGANAFTVYDNLFKITFKSPKRTGELTEIISIYPKIEGLKITNKVLSSELRSDQAYVFGSPLDKTRLIRGTIPKGRNAFTIKAAIHHPEEILARDLMNKLSREGVFISGEIKFTKVNSSKFQTIFIHESPTLAEIVKVINHESVNLFTEHLVRQIALEKTGVGGRERGIEIIKELWESRGLIEGPFFMEDGSGLSHFNAISPSHITFVLDYMYNHSENKEAFINSLPNAGNGTLSSISTKFFPANSLKAKSGSMTRIRCYAGYLETDNGKVVAFSIMFNNFQGTHLELINEIESLLLMIKKS